MANVMNFDRENKAIWITSLSDYLDSPAQQSKCASGLALDHGFGYTLH